VAEPHAICEDGRIFWRGSNPDFVYMIPETARALLDRGNLPQAMLNDLARAIAEQDELELQSRDRSDGIYA